ncbi:unnamed protein product [Hermetia illucens]|uniref:Protein G12 n=1 Tax=Hermetia illucens TaxID=343691 RepID=A0A7R8URI3_HERIL|nr:uncharacterized protein LOC119651475 [Hermetia illucens]CAD7085616.1 unnamed protein product [Hermetia illucens]
MKVIVLVLATVALCGAAPRQEGPGCRAPNGGGLVPVLDEFLALVPVEEILEIALTAITSDPEVQTVMEYLSSSEFYGIVQSVRFAPEFDGLVKFACQELYFDAIYYINIANGILGFPEITKKSAPRAGGFNAMLQEILALIPLDTLKSLLEEKLASDYYVQLAFQKINSDEFGAIIEGLQANVAYVDMKDRLRGLGVDIDGIIETIGKIFKP